LSESISRSRASVAARGEGLDLLQKDGERFFEL